VTGGVGWVVDHDRVRGTLGQHREPARFLVRQPKPAHFLDRPEHGQRRGVAGRLPRIHREDQGGRGAVAGQGRADPKWVSLDEADFAGQKPLLDKVLAAAQAKDADQTGQYLNQLSNYKDHSAEAASYLTSYGLTDCATLEQA
jgi:hypothetical protein